MIKMFLIATTATLAMEILFFRFHTEKKLDFWWWSFTRIINSLLFGYFSFGFITEVLIQNSNLSLLPIVTYLMSMFFLTWIIAGLFFGWLRFNRVGKTEKERAKVLNWAERQSSGILSWFEFHMAIGYFSAILFFLDWLYQEKSSDEECLI